MLLQRIPELTGTNRWISLIIGRYFCEQTAGVERAREHFHRAVGRTRPQLAGAIPVKLDAVSIGIAQIKRLAHAVVRFLGEARAGLQRAEKAVRGLTWSAASASGIDSASGSPQPESGC